MHSVTLAKVLSVKMKIMIKSDIHRDMTQATPGLVSRRCRKVFAPGPGSPQQNLEPYDYKAAIFTYS